MRELDELTDLVSQLNDATTFCDAADHLISWAQRLTGSEAVVLRLNERSEDGGTWVPACRHVGADEAFARDEALVSADECVCGRVATGATDPSLPFFTPRGSFVWGHLDTIAAQFPPTQLGPIRGRCVSEGYESVAVVPLGDPVRPIGCLHLADRRPNRFDGNLEIVEAACRLAGRILLQHHGREREHAAFEIIQRALVPPETPAIAGLELGVCFSSATDIARIGGDFYDVVDRGAEGCMLFVGDYSGHGIEAAGMAARARYAMAGLARRAKNPGTLLTLANAQLNGVLPEDHFVSAVACLVRPARGSVLVALAGHPAPIRLRGETAVEIEAPHNAPLGLSPHASFAETEFTLEYGDVVALVTDGVIESRRDGRLFGLEGIHQVWQADSRQTDGSADLLSLTRSICDASGAHHDSALPSDDRLALGIRLAGGRMPVRNVTKET